MTHLRNQGALYTIYSLQKKAAAASMERIAHGLQ